MCECTCMRECLGVRISARGREGEKTVDVYVLRVNVRADCVMRVQVCAGVRMSLHMLV